MPLSAIKKKGVEGKKTLSPLEKRRRERPSLLPVREEAFRGGEDRPFL